MRAEFLAKRARSAHFCLRRHSRRAMIGLQSLCGKRFAVRVDENCSMATLPLPIKLNKEPLIDAVFELRFATANSFASNALTSILYADQLKVSEKPPQVDRLQVAEIPTAIRNADPFLKYQALARIQTTNFNILVGDFNIVVGIKLPYTGWSNFRPAIIRSVGAVLGSSLIKNVERYSLKYVDIIEGSTNEQQLQRVNLHLGIGNHKITSEHTGVRVELGRSEFTDIVQIVTSAQVSIENVGMKSGLLIDVDTIVDHNTDDFAKFLEELSDRLDRIHSENKYMFFQTLTKETIEFLEPVYQ